MSRCAFVCSALLLACEPPLPEPPIVGQADAGAVVTAEPPAPLGAVPAVVRLHVTGDRSKGLRLFEGELSAYHLSRLDQELPDTLVERLVPAVTWTAEDETIMALGRALEPDATYTLTEPAVGALAVIRVASDAPSPDLARVWPPLASACGAVMLYCGHVPLRAGAAAEPIVFEPGGLSGWAERSSIRHGENGDTCMRLALTDPAVAGQRLAAPLRTAGAAVEPSLMILGPTPPLPRAACADGQVPLGPACATVLDDRLIFQGPAAPSFWSFGAPLRFAGAVAENERMVLRGLEPSSTREVEFTVMDLSGRTDTYRAVIETLSPMSHLVINEVLANPLGPEPAQEWVEIVNDGTTAVDIAGWGLEDSGGVTMLPPARLEPGELAVIVGEDFDRHSTFDVRIDESATVVVVDRVGTNGLSNSGEPLALRDAGGTVRSRFPSSPRGEPGTSVARAYPGAADDDPAAFGLHAEPGASPGWDNVVVRKEEP